jgi:hypothetical protein
MAIHTFYVRMYNYFMKLRDIHRTGRQPPRVGMPGVINSLSAAGLPLTEVTLADDLKAAGQ